MRVTMPKDLQKAREMFLHAVGKLPLEEWDGYLAEACEGDSELAQQVGCLLQVHREAGSFMEAPAPGLELDATLNQPQLEKIGTQIGPYKLLEMIGEGGMGVVYMAEQKEPVRRVVALKVVKPGMDSRQVLARFDAERQALAMMDHPSIARIIDAGMTDMGRPYFVMELVRGIPINEFCDQKRLSLRERLELFLQVCQAVQHAHQKGIIHRDLKPSNVLVTMLDVQALPKVIDFGIAKAFGPQLTDHTQVTGFAQFVGTPQYMSPEQAEMNQFGVDTRSDVYSLGVMLYELLTGSTPFAKELLKKTSFEELRRMLREQEPPRPSARISTLDAQALSTISERRSVDPRRIKTSIRGELDWIVMKALERDRERRYESAIALAADLQRYLNDEAVHACPPSMAYRFQKYARRHGAVLVTVATIATVLVGATIVSSSLAAWAIQQKEIADFHKIDAQQEREVALDARALAEQQEQLAKQQMLLAKKQRDAADYDAYVAGIQLVQHDLISGRARSEVFDKLTPGPDRPDFRGWEWRYLHSRLHCQKFTLPFQAPNSALAWSPDGSSLATVDVAGRVNIWDVGSGKLNRALNDCPGEIHSMSWSADGKSLAAGSDRKVIAIWDLDTGSMRLLRGHAAAVKCVDWNADSLRLATGGDDGNVYIWDSKTGDQVAQYAASGGPVTSLDWHPDGIRLLANSGWNSQDLKIWNSENGSELSLGRRSYVVYAEFSPDGEHLAYGNGTISIVDLESGQELAQLEGKRATWSPDGKQMACRCIDGTIRIWDAEKGTQIESIPGQSVLSPIAWSPTGGLIASAEDGVVKVWDAARLGASFTHVIPDRNVLSVAFSPDGRRILASAQYGLVKMWDAQSREELFSFQSGLN